MSEYDYPFIPPKYYPAVMGACHMIRATGCFYRAVNYYSDKYGVDPAELVKHIRARQAAGQRRKLKGKAPVCAGCNKGKRFKWYLVVFVSSRGYRNEPLCSEPQIVKGLTSETVTKRLREKDWRQGIFYSEGMRTVVAEFDTQEEAEQALPNWREFTKEYEYQ